MSEPIGISISVAIEPMTTDIFFAWLIRDWSSLTDGIYIMSSPSAAQRTSLEGSLLIWWGENDPTRFNRLCAIDWRQSRPEKLIVTFTGVGKKDDSSLASYDRLSQQLLRWLKRRWSIEIEVKEQQPVRESREPADQKAPGNRVLPETVRRYHQLAKTTTMSANSIREQLKTDTVTYYRYCEKYTGEAAIIMSARNKLIRKKQWPARE